MTRELSIQSIILGLSLSVILGAANVYLGLKVGMTVSASIPAAVMSMLLLRLLPGSGTILEANQAQTAASAGESLAAGVIFTMPALILVGAWHEFDMLLTTLVAFSGGLLGILLNANAVLKTKTQVCLSIGITLLSCFGVQSYRLLVIL